MKVNILSVSASDFKKRLLTELSIIIASAVILLAINLTLLFVANENTKIAFICINVITDVAFAWFVVAYLNISWLPRLNKLRLVNKKENISYKISGIIEKVGEKKRYNKFDCYKIFISDEENGKAVYCIEGTVENLLIPDIKVKLTLVDNLVIECEVEDE